MKRNRREDIAFLLATSSLIIVGVALIACTIVSALLK